MILGRERAIRQLLALSSGARLALVGPPGVGRRTVIRAAFPDAVFTEVGERVDTSGVVVVTPDAALDAWAAEVEATVLVVATVAPPGWERLSVPPLAEADALALLGEKGPHADAIVRWTEGLPALIVAARGRLEIVGASELATRLEGGIAALGSDVVEALDAGRLTFDAPARAALDVLGWFTGPFELALAEAVADLDVLQQLVVAGWIRAAEPAGLPGERWYRVPHFARPAEVQVPACLVQRIEELSEGAPAVVGKRLLAYSGDLQRAFDELFEGEHEGARAVGLALARLQRTQGSSAARERVLVQLHRRFPEDAEVYLTALDARALPPDEDVLERIAAEGPHAQGGARALSRALHQRGAHDEALAWAERAVAFDHDDVRSQCQLAEVLIGLDRTGDAELAYRDALASARRQQDPHSEAAVAGFLGMLYGARADDEAARDQLAHASQLLEQLGDPFGAALYRVLLGDLALANGRAEAAVEHFQAALTVLDARGATRWTAWCRIGCVLAGALGGTYDEQALHDALLAGRLVEDPNVRALVLAAAASVTSGAGGDPTPLLTELEHTGSYLVPQLQRAVEAVQRTTPDPRAVTWAVQTRAISRLAGRPAARPPDLRCEESGAWFEVDGGARVSLETRLHNRQVFGALLDAWRRGSSIDVDGLLEAGWPGERVLAEAGRARVYTAIATLRRQGLAPFIVKLPDGYTLAPSLRIQFEPTT